MSKAPLNHMMLHEDELADEFDAILNYRETHDGIVLPGGATFTYYVSYSTGDSGNAGTSANAPFRTPADLPPLNAGESVGFLRGDTWPAAALPFVLPAGNGTADNRIVFGAYGDELDPKPVFDGETTVADIIQAMERNYITFSDLRIINQQNVANARSISVGSTSDATRRSIHLYRVETEDTINGGDDGVYMQRNVDLYCEDCTFVGSENHLACHPGATYSITIEAYGCEFSKSGNSSCGSATGGTVTAYFEDCTWTHVVRVFGFSAATDSALAYRCRVNAMVGATGFTEAHPCNLDAYTCTFIYSLIDLTGMTGSLSAAGLIQGSSRGPYLLVNCTFLGNSSAGSRGQLYATATMNVYNSAFVRWSRVGFTGTAESCYSCYFDTLVSDAIDNTTYGANEVTTAGYCDLATGRPNSSLTDPGPNKGVDLSTITLPSGYTWADFPLDFAGAAVNQAAPTRGCYENAA